MEFDALDDLYQEIILDHYRSPRNRGALPDPDLSSEGFNPFCGDQVILTMELAPAPGGRIGAVGIEGQGCSISQAAASIMGDLLKGKTLQGAEELVRTFKGVMAGGEIPEDQQDELAELAALEGVKQFPIRIKCALLPFTTLQDAIADYRKTHAG